MRRLITASILVFGFLLWTGFSYADTTADLKVMAPIGWSLNNSTDLKYKVLPKENAWNFTAKSIKENWTNTQPNKIASFKAISYAGSFEPPYTTNVNYTSAFAIFNYGDTSCLYNAQVNCTVEWTADQNHAGNIMWEPSIPVCNLTSLDLQAAMNQDKCNQLTFSTDGNGGPNLIIYADWKSKG